MRWPHLEVVLVSQILPLITATAPDRPNILVLLADDLGIGDVGCFGNSTIATPNIDRLCNEGLKLSHHLAGAPLCTPSRASFLTGRYPLRTGLDNDGNDSPRVIVYASGRNGLPANETTWARILSDEGYKTAAFGKWHLGWDESSRGDQRHGPLGHGFQYFFGLPFTLVDGFELNVPFLTYSGWKQSGNLLHDNLTAGVLAFIVVMAVYNKEFGYTLMVLIILSFIIGWFFLEHFAFHSTHWWGRSLYMEKFLNSVLMENTKVHEQPIQLDRLSDQLVTKGLTFLDEAHGSKEPFAIYFAFPNVHTPLVPHKRFRGQSQHGRYGDSILEMDSAIGKLLDKLDQLNMSENTLVYFTSDHGAHIDIGRKGGSNGIFRGGKSMGGMEGAIRVPGIMRWPGTIPKGSQTHSVTSLLDFLPTLMDILAVRKDDVQLDGKSIYPLMKQPQEIPSEARMLRHYCGTALHALTYQSEAGEAFKVYFHEPILNSDGHCGIGALCPCSGPGVTNHTHPVVYDLQQDPAEKQSLAIHSDRYLTLLGLFREEQSQAQSEWHPPSQFSDFWNVIPRPWFQACARFPLCRS